MLCHSIKPRNTERFLAVVAAVAIYRQKLDPLKYVHGQKAEHIESVLSKFK